MTSMPFFKDLADDADNVSDDNPATLAFSKKIEAAADTAVFQRRNQNWSEMDLANELITGDPLGAIASLTSRYWRGRRHAALKALLKGVFAANDKLNSPGGGDGTPGSGDLTFVSGGPSYNDGVTDLNHNTLADTLGTLGVYQDLEGGILLVHPNIYTSMRKDNLIDFIKPSDQLQPIPFFGNLRVVQDASMPTGDLLNNPGRVDYESWILPAGSIQVGFGSAKVPQEISRIPDAGNGGGQTKLFQRVVYSMHLPGYSWNVTHANTSAGGPSNAASTSQLAHEDSWLRVFPERAQVPVARLISTEA